MDGAGLIRKPVVVFLVLAVFAFSVLLIIYQLLLVRAPVETLEPVTAHASNVGYAQFCINHPPSMDVPCNATMSQNSSYYCELNLTDADVGNLTASTTWWSNLTVFNVSPAGVINFTPNNSHVGNHTVLFLVEDDSGCPDNSTTLEWNFSVENINDPPFLAVEIEEVEFQANTTIIAFALNDHFVDPDGDPMNYTSTIPSLFNMSISNTSQVRFSSEACDIEEVVTFFATDPYNATGTSNEVKVKVKCAPPNTDGDNSQGGSSGGGGGGAVMGCRENWECDPWLPCIPTNFSWRRCYDLGGCKGELYQKRACVYEGERPACMENWLCTPWGKCHLNTTQYRTCEDLNMCGSTIARPPLQQGCIYQATCDDGIQNGNETGVDCGGECAECAIIEGPRPLPSQARIATWILISLILAVLLVSGVLHYYRAQIAQALAMLGFMLRHRAYKEILLDAAQRRSLFERIQAYEQRIKRKDQVPEEIHAGLATLIRSYYAEALGVHLEAIPEEVDAKCKELGLREETAAMLRGLFGKLPYLEQERIELDEYFVLATLEELRTTVCLTSDYVIEELQRDVEEIAITDKMSFYDEIFARAINIMRAVQFDQVEEARKEYMTLLTRYDPLSEIEKEQIYPELRWVFETVKFKSEITGARVVQKPLQA